MTRTAVTFMGGELPSLRCSREPVMAYVCAGGMPQMVLQHRLAVKARDELRP